MLVWSKQTYNSTGLWVLNTCMWVFQGDSHPVNVKVILRSGDKVRIRQMPLALEVSTITDQSGMWKQHGSADNETYQSITYQGRHTQISKEIQVCRLETVQAELTSRTTNLTVQPAASNAEMSAKMQGFFNSMALS